MTTVVGPGPDTVINCSVPARMDLESPMMWVNYGPVEILPAVPSVWPGYRLSVEVSINIVSINTIPPPCNH